MDLDITDARVTALMLNVQMLERMGKRYFRLHSSHCGCTDIYACQTCNARQYREMLDSSDSEMDKVIATWMRG